MNVFGMLCRKLIPSGLFSNPIARRVEFPEAISKGKTEEGALANVRESLGLSLKSTRVKRRDKATILNRVNVVCPQNLTVGGTDHLKASSYSYFASR